MLLKYGARNFFCFKEGIEISLELGPQCPKAISRGNSVANLLCIKGANASGKTNALKILGFLNFFCCNSFSAKPDAKIAVDSFFNNDYPIDIYCEFIFNNVQYLYELSLTPKAIISEKLSRKVKRFVPIFERKENKLVFCIREFADLEEVKLRTNASIISSGFQYEVPCIEPMYTFFGSIILNVNLTGKVDFSGDYRSISKYYHENPDVFKTALTILKECDLGIFDIKIHSLEEEDGKEYYYPVFLHDTKAKNNWLLFQSQSLGTQTLFRTIPYYLFVITHGGILVMDEFDTDFHPHMLPRIVRYFDKEDINKKNAQMLFSTHNTDILEFMGKYRTVFVNKESSESYGYRLDEIPGDIIRNDRPLTPLYNLGKIGGVPRI